MQHRVATKIGSDGKAAGKPIEIVPDHQNKTDIAAAIVR